MGASCHFAVIPVANRFPLLPGPCRARHDRANQPTPQGGRFRAGFESAAKPTRWIARFARQTSATTVTGSLAES